jgi:uncharacterized membrane protein
MKNLNQEYVNEALKYSRYGIICTSRLPEHFESYIFADKETFKARKKAKATQKLNTILCLMICLTITLLFYIFCKGY